MTVRARLLVLFDWNGTVMDDLDRAVTATNDASRAGGSRRWTAPHSRIRSRCR